MAFGALTRIVNKYGNKNEKCLVAAIKVTEHLQTL